MMAKVQILVLPLLAAGTLLGAAQSVVAASTTALVPLSPSLTGFIIGPETGDAHSHAAFPGLPHDIVKVSARVRVTKAIDQGLNFFAIQVNFPNKTWAHGGPQLVGGKYQMNWGGLVSRGGGSADYQKEDPEADLQLMQNGPNVERSKPYAWTVGNEYVITIERDAPVTFPPGQYVFIGTGPQTLVSNTRTMWKWKFTMTTVDTGGPTVESILYDAADRISSFYIWNECGYGSCGKGQSATWSMPVYTRLDASGMGIQTEMLKRF
jgi:hypothetical protein